MNIQIRNFDELESHCDVIDFEHPKFSKKQVVDAGKLLKGKIDWNPSDAEEKERLVETFRIAHNWRAAHALPMLQMRRELAGMARRSDKSAISAARLKRMSSIRKKLNRAPETLYQMQDLGGCRVIVKDMIALKLIVDAYRNGVSRHEYLSEDNYIGEPKNGGYRSFHMIYKYKGTGETDNYNSRSIRIELQLRTRLQHIWATAVEAVGMVRDEDLKGGDGCQDWLRLFQLMSSEFADDEQCPIVPGTQRTKQLRKEELTAINEKIGAVDQLQRMSSALQFTDREYKSLNQFVLIQFDRNGNRLNIRPLNSKNSIRTYDNAENNKNNLNTVLVEIGKVADLKAAYPNYFLDVTEFTKRLKLSIHGKPWAIFDGDWWRKFAHSSLQN